MVETMECLVVESKEDMARVRVNLHSECSSCGLCEGGSNTVYYDAINKLHAQKGQLVVIEMEKQNVLNIAFIIFILPLLVAVASIILGVCVADYLGVFRPVAAVILTVVALIPTFYFIKKYDAKVQGKSTAPVITKILKE